MLAKSAEKKRKNERKKEREAMMMNVSNERASNKVHDNVFFHSIVVNLNVSILLIINTV